MGRIATYTSPQIVGEFLEVINDMVQGNILQEMQGSSSFSIMVDESTDISILEQLVIYGRTVSGGMLKTQNLKIVDIDDGKATTILAAIISYLQSSGLDPSNLSSFWFSWC